MDWVHDIVELSTFSCVSVQFKFELSLQPGCSSSPVLDIHEINLKFNYISDPLLSKQFLTK